jgi:hypothetical protein
MGKRGFERFFRLRELVDMERIKRAGRKKLKPRWAACFSGELPILYGGNQTQDWARQLKGLLHDQNIM